jgi:hypothetical protein
MDRILPRTIVGGLIKEEKYRAPDLFAWQLVALENVDQASNPRGWR